MKKILIPTLLTIAIAGLAGAQTPAKKAPATQKTIQCAVMPGKPIDIATATKNHMYADYKGKRYFFCCAGCPAEFKKEPAKFAKGPSIPTPKAPKATK